MDVGAFTELVRKHQAAVAAVAYAIVRDREIAHDLTQEAFVTAWRRISEVREPERIGAWLCGIVRFLARDHRRVERRRQSLRERHVDAVPAAPPTPSPLDRVVAREDDELLATVVGDLPASYREPLLLHYVGGCSLSEIAQTLALKEDAVKQRLSRARAALRDEPRFAAAALALAPLPSFTDATVRAATTSTPPVPTKESFMSAHPILVATLLAGALAAGGLAVAASRTDDDSQPAAARMRDTNSGTRDVSGSGSSSPAAAPIARAAQDRAALLQQIRIAHARKHTISATGAAPPATATMVYDFAGETLTAGVVPKPPGTVPHTRLNKAAIRDNLAGARADVLACYESALARTPDLAGTLTVRVVVEGEPDIGGVISDASIVSDTSTFRDAQLESCILDAIAVIELPAPDEGIIVTVHYPYTFEPR